MALYIFDSERLFRIARRSLRRAGAGENRSDEAVSAILFSAAGLEGWVNELADWAEIDGSGRDDSRVQSLAVVLAEAEEQRASLHLKVQLASALVGSLPFHKGDRIYQDLSLLIALRNAIVHLKPERYGKEAEPIHPLVKKLKSRGLLPGPVEAELFGGSWLDKIATVEIATWAYEAAVGIIKEVVEKMPEDPFKVRLRQYADQITRTGEESGASAAVDA